MTEVVSQLCDCQCVSCGGAVRFSEVIHLINFSQTVIWWLGRAFYDQYWLFLVKGTRGRPRVVGTGGRGHGELWIDFLGGYPTLCAWIQRELQKVRMRSSLSQGLRDVHTRP